MVGHASCELRRYLDSVPPETPIQDVVDRCRVWESHADPEVRRVSKPGPDSIYPAYMINDSDKIVEEIQVAAAQGRDSTDRRSPGCYECEAEKFIRVVRRAASVGALTGFGCTG